MWIFVGFLWRGPIKRQYDVESGDISLAISSDFPIEKAHCLHSFLLLHLQISGQHHYIAIWSPSSAFQWSQNAWNGHFTLISVLAPLCWAWEIVAFEASCMQTRLVFRSGEWFVQELLSSSWLHRRLETWWKESSSFVSSIQLITFAASVSERRRYRGARCLCFRVSVHRATTAGTSH